MTDQKWLACDDSGRMPGAGCADDALLSHLRSEGPHVRGRRAVDLLLGEE